MTYEKDADFTNQIGIGGTTINLGDPIFIQISAGLPSGLDFYVDYCRGAPDSESTDTYISLFR